MQGGGIEQRHGAVLRPHQQHDLDDVVHAATIFGIGHQHLQAEALLQPPTVEVLLHGEGGAEQAYPARTRLHDRVRGRVGDMKQRQGAGGFDAIGAVRHRPCGRPAHPSRRRAAAA
ncbi:hypothetical protein G6F57_021544 [Rhizopus arrhizus]|nr:hypothetical protein G6F57_021544 [Rhizopus arrhizus]